MGGSLSCVDDDPCGSSAELVHVPNRGAAPPPPRLAPLSPDERRWVPEGLFRGRLLLGVRRGCWALDDVALVLCGDGGRALGAVGPRALARAEGVCMDFIEGHEVFSVCLERLSTAVYSMLLVCRPRPPRLSQAPERPASAPNANARGSLVREGSASSSLVREGSSPATGVDLGPAFLVSPEFGQGASQKSRPQSVCSAFVVGVVHGAAIEVGEGAHDADEVPEPPPQQFQPLCMLEVPEHACPQWLPTEEGEHAARSSAGMNAMVLLALHCGLHHGHPWELEALGKALLAASPARGGLLAAVSPMAAELAARATRRFWGGHAACETLCDPRLCSLAHPDAGASPGKTSPRAAAAVAQELAVADRRAGELHSEMQVERQRARQLCEDLVSAREALSSASTALEGQQCELDAWRREALIRRHQNDGDLAGLIAMLPQLPVPGDGRDSRDAAPMEETPAKAAPTAVAPTVVAAATSAGLSVEPDLTAEAAPPKGIAAVPAPAAEAPANASAGSAPAANTAGAEAEPQAEPSGTSPPAPVEVKRSRRAELRTTRQRRAAVAG
uniref:Uncharacterized protein n=1 Tax=Pyrodinium bahamense TaxID=73915 RepID=A0A7S0B1D3_9DINO